jgi:hypothetical protein
MVVLTIDKIGQKEMRLRQPIYIGHFNQSVFAVCRRG